MVTASYVDPSVWPVAVAIAGHGISCAKCELVLLDKPREDSFELAELASAIETHIPNCPAWRWSA